MSKLHVVTTLMAGFASEDSSRAGVVGAYFDKELATAVRSVAGADATVYSVEIGHVPQDCVQAMAKLGITVGRLKDRPVDSVPLATLQDILDVSDDTTFQQIADEMPSLLRSLRPHEGFAWPVHWRPGGPSTLTAHYTDGCVRRELMDLESKAWRDANATRLAACWNAFEGFETEKFDGKSIAEFVSKEAYLMGLNPAPDGAGAKMSLSGIACQLLAESFAGQFVGSGAINYLEVNLEHEAVGPMSVTIQRTEGKTPGHLRSLAERELAATKELLAQREAEIAVLKSVAKN